MKIVVAPNGNICHPSGAKMYKPGEELPQNVFTKDQLQAHLGSGYAVRVQDSYGKSDSEAAALSSTPPGVNPNPPAMSAKETGKPLVESFDTGRPAAPFMSSGVTGGIQTNVVDAPQSQLNPPMQSPWIIDPAAIATKGLDELNVMIMERDAKVVPFNDPAEARAWLSQNWKSGAPGTVSV